LAGLNCENMSGCNSCSTDIKENSEEVSGCKSNGSCGTSSCNRMNSFDWLSDMDIPMIHRFDIVEVKFKAGKKEFFRNSDSLELTTGDAVIVEMPTGAHLGHISLMGELVRLQMSRKKVRDDDEIRKVYRLANTRDIEKWSEAQNRELPMLYRTRELIDELKLGMKLSDVECQADLTKATFYYSAEDRVDFRELIKMMATEFKLRIEMRQISLRQEAGRLGGIGSCGRELCCSTWLSDFKNVSTAAARYQNLSLNPSKLSGQCGRLKCCLNYELDTYIEALKDIPKVDYALKTGLGEARLQKTDIFRKMMWFGFNDDNNWVSLDVKRVQEILDMNAKGLVPDTLLENKIQLDPADDGKINKDLEQLDKKYSIKSAKKKKKKKNRSRPFNKPGTNPNQPKENGQ
jgi:cell fate regulator YaaT (PSP1 superfamily)